MELDYSSLVATLQKVGYTVWNTPEGLEISERLDGYLIKPRYPHRINKWEMEQIETKLTKQGYIVTLGPLVRKGKYVGYGIMVTGINDGIPKD